MKLVKAAGAALGATALVALAGCGVPVDSAPTALAKAGIPFHLLAPSSPSLSAPLTRSPSETAVEIYLIGPAGRLVAVEREVPSDQQSPASVLAVLVNGPTSEETILGGLQSAIPPQTSVLGVSVSNGIATVDIGGTFGQLVGTAQIEAVAQVVFTVMSLPAQNISGVAFELSGQPVEVPVGTGAQVPVANESQFPSLAP